MLSQTLVHAPPKLPGHSCQVYIRRLVRVHYIDLSLKTTLDHLQVLIADQPHLAHLSSPSVRTSLVVYVTHIQSLFCVLILILT